MADPGPRQITDQTISVVLGNPSDPFRAPRWRPIAIPAFVAIRFFAVLRLPASPIAEGLEAANGPHHLWFGDVVRRAERGHLAFLEGEGVHEQNPCGSVQPC